MKKELKQKLKEDILELNSKGLSNIDISRQLGCSKSVITYHLGPNGKEKNLESNYKRREKNREWFEKYKQKFVCVKCGEGRHWVIDFHHIDPSTKLDSVANLLQGASREKVILEIGKCIAICANCHRDLHYQEKLNK